MANFSGRFMKVWEIEDKGNFKLVNLGDSKKEKDGSYKNFTWYKCAFVGNAARKGILKDDKISVTQGQISQEKYNDKWYTKVVVFDFEVESSTGNQVYSSKYNSKKETTLEDQKGGFSDDIPF